MVTTHVPTLQVFRHASDDAAHDCGRACAQSIISSLTQGVPAGNITTSSDEAQLVPVTQGELRALESDPTDTPSTWFTHPDELVALLNQSPHLVALGYTDWRVVAVDSRPELLEHIGASLDRGFPAILNIRPSDHWVLVRSVDRTDGVVSFVRMFDPLRPRNAPPASAHTYRDGCSADGDIPWETLDLSVGSLATWSLSVGSFPPANYAGKYVGIAYGPPPTRIDDLLAMRRRLCKLQRRPVGSTPPERIREEWTRVAVTYGVHELQTILREHREPIIRYVHDIDAKERGYTIAATFSETLGHGVIGIFDFADQTFLHARLTSDRTLIDSLAGDPAEPLWWTRRPLETLFSPHFPFRRVLGQIQPTYRRLADDFELVVPPPTRTRPG